MNYNNTNNNKKILTTTTTTTSNHNNNNYNTSIINNYNNKSSSRNYDINQRIGTTVICRPQMYSEVCLSLPLHHQINFSLSWSRHPVCFYLSIIIVYKATFCGVYSVTLRVSGVTWIAFNESCLEFAFTFSPY